MGEVNDRYRFEDFLKAWEHLVSHYVGQVHGPVDSHAVYICLVFAEQLHEIITDDSVDEPTRQRADNLKSFVKRVVCEILKDPHPANSQ